MRCKIDLFHIVAGFVLPRFSFPLCIRISFYVLEPAWVLARDFELTMLALIELKTSLNNEFALIGFGQEGSWPFLWCRNGKEESVWLIS